MSFTITHHLGVGDLGQQVCQVVSTQPLVTVVQLQATDSSSQAASGDHGRRVHGKAIIWREKRKEYYCAISQAAALGHSDVRKSHFNL